MKKKFVAPRVVQQVHVCLENDLLQGGSIKDNSLATIEAQDYVDYDMDYVNEDVETYWE